MDGIPAASIAGVNLDRIREHHPDSAREIERIGRSLVAGTETEHELLQLCELLFRVGEKRKAEELLLPNAKDGDVLHDLYRRLFGSVAEENYQNALKAFSSDFGVILARIRSARLLSSVFDCSKATSMSYTRRDLDELLVHKCEAHITYEPHGEIVADIYVVAPPEESVGSSKRSLALQFVQANWVIESKEDV